MKKFRLKPDPDGLIHVYEPFWNIDNQEAAPPLAIYADLILTGDERNFKIAEEIPYIVTRYVTENNHE